MNRDYSPKACQRLSCLAEYPERAVVRSRFFVGCFHCLLELGRFDVVHSSTRYTIDLYGMPLFEESPISQVRELEYPYRIPASSICFLKARKPHVLSSGIRKPLSPAKPQHPTSAGTNTSEEQRRARSMILDAIPMRLVEHVTCTAIGVSCRWNMRYGDRKSLMNSAGS